MSMAQTRDWRGMKDMWARLLKERTGKGADAWNRLSRADGCNRRESQRRCQSRLDSGRLSRSIPKCWVGCNRPTMKTADQADLADDFLDLSEPRFRGANLGPLLPVPPLRG